MGEVDRSIEHALVERKEFESWLGANRLENVVKFPEFSANLLLEAVEHFSRGTLLVGGYCLFCLRAQEELPNRIRFVSRLAFPHDGLPCLGQTRRGEVDSYLICPCTCHEFHRVQPLVMCWGRVSEHPVCFHKDVAHWLLAGAAPTGTTRSYDATADDRENAGFDSLTNGGRP